MTFHVGPLLPMEKNRVTHFNNTWKEKDYCLWLCEGRSNTEAKGT